jgi:hypothetical protein
MTEGERLGDFAERAAGQMQPPNRGVVLDARAIGDLFGIGQSGRRGSGAVEELGIERHGGTCLV